MTTSTTKITKTKDYTKTERFYKVNCSPHKTNRSVGCLDKKTLYKMRDLWNARHPDVIIQSQNPVEIYNSLQTSLSKCCNNEICWFEQFDGFRELKKNHMPSLYAPFSPASWEKNPHEWLSSDEIADTMKQFEDAYPTFLFVGPSPIDFDKQKIQGSCVWPELCNFSLETCIQENVHHIGIILNTDTHDNPGQHWISLYIDIPRKEILFFDSTGDPMPPEVRRFIDRVTWQGKQLTSPIVFQTKDTKGVVHQKENTECGMYSLFFIINMLTQKITWRELKSRRITDDYVNRFRQIYFNRSNTPMCETKFGPKSKVI